MKFRTAQQFLFFLFIGSMSMSCTVLQWRSSDTKIKEHFTTLEVPTRISYFEIDSLDLSIRVQHIERDTNTINLLFFHGSPSSLSAWNAYLTDTILAQKANMRAIDRPGYGYSNFGNEMTSIKLQAQLMNAMIEAYDFKNVILIGSSYGGPLVAEIAALNKSIKGVVMISPAIDPKQEKKIWASRLTQWWGTRWLVPTGYRVAGDEKTVHSEELALLEKDWSLVKIPVIHIHGDKDEIVPYGNVDYTTTAFSNITIVTTPDTGHEIAWGRPELIKPHIYRLIALTQQLPTE